MKLNNNIMHCMYRPDLNKRPSEAHTHTVINTTCTKDNIHQSNKKLKKKKNHDNDAQSATLDW